eukprot:CAMPEP_0175972544 /NCGR_PEP_ID=MMETSP0108-20121206/42289_1 /TAXON_ID=195067 ORGANISM="Goniomonas pacifica, Strain CCMP1869" /NCGR_SAMPLE_ID=MMETSP0108 /ASSEMBLY_ACC=CAM_ASM_000204 /LENGTH=114 /DNA_ID=CAMNT_0017301875 /DNA_START=186 /DNA_END=527 /DNA_ORIENTATION=+
MPEPQYQPETPAASTKDVTQTFDRPTSQGVQRVAMGDQWQLRGAPHPSPLAPGPTLGMVGGPLGPALLSTPATPSHTVYSQDEAFYGAHRPHPAPVDARAVPVSVVPAFHSGIQ